MASKNRNSRKRSKKDSRPETPRPWVHTPLGLVAVGLATYALAFLVLTGGRRILAEAAPPSPIVITDFGMKDTSTTGNPKESYNLAGQAGGIYQVDNANRHAVSFTSLKPAHSNNAVQQIDLDKTSGDVIYGASNGEIVRVDMTTNTSTTVGTVSGADFKVAAADNNSSSVDAWAIDANTNSLYEFKSSGPSVLGNPSFGQGPTELAGPKPGNNNVVALGDGSAEIYRLDVTLLVDYDDTFAGTNVEPTGLAVADADYCYVSINDGSTAKVLQVDLRASTFGFVTPVMGTYSNVSAVDISVAGPWVTVLMSDSANNETTARVFDVGVPSSPLYVGSVDLSLGYQAYGGLTTSLIGGETYDDLEFVWANATQDMSVTTGRDVDNEWTYGTATTVASGLNPVVTPAAPGSHNQAALGCCGPCPPWGPEGQGEVRHNGTCGTATMFPGGASGGGRIQGSTGGALSICSLGSFPGRGKGLEIELTYRSRSNFPYRYGNGCNLSQDVRLKTETNGDLTFQSAYGRMDTYVSNGAGGFVSPRHYDTTLVASGSGHTITDRFGQTATFDANGYRTSLADRYGNTHTFTYSSDKLTKITDSLGRIYNFNYDTTGRLSSVVDFGGRTWTLKYDYIGNLRQLTTPASAQFPNGRTTTYSYSPRNADSRLQGNLIHVENPGDEVVQTLKYNEHDMVVEEVRGDTSKIISYDITNNQTTFVDHAGNTTRWTFDANAMVTETKIYTKGLRTGEPTAFTTAYTIDSVSGFVKAVVYPRGNRTDYTYDSSLNLTEVRHRTTDTSTNSGTDLVTSYQYTAQYNQMSQVTDPKGNVTSMTVDSSGNTTAVSRPAVTQPTSQSIAETFAYDSYGRITSATDAESRVTNFVYYTSGSQNGYLHKVIRDPDGLSITTTFQYDQYGNVTSVTDPSGATTTITVDAENFVTQIQAPTPLNYKRKFTYDANRNLTLLETENRDKDGTLDPTTPWIETSYTYNEMGWRLTATQDLTSSSQAVTTYEYDGEGKVTKIQSPTGEETKIEYDERALLFKLTRGYGAAEASTIQVDYDANGNRSKTINGEGDATNFTYDLFDRATKRTNALSHYVSWTYDKNGNVLTAAAYNASNVLQAKTTNHFDEVNRIWKRVQDRFGSGLTPSYPTVTIQHDKTGRVTEIKDPLNNKTTYSYDTAGRQTKVQDAVGNETEWVLDARGQATKIKRKDIPTAGGSETFETEFVYDALGRLTSKREIDRLNASNILTTNFSYDSRENLTFRVDAEGNPVRWAYDLANRQTSYERALAIGTSIDDFTNSILETASFDASGRLTSVTDDNLNTTSYSYDALSRVFKTTFADTKFVTRTFDKNDRVKTWTDQNGTVVTNTYDMLSRLTSRTVNRATGVLGTTSETYSYDALNRMLTAKDNDYEVQFTYDSVGNELKETQGYTVTGQEKWRTVTSTYTDAGSRSAIQYPSAFSVLHQRDAIYRMTAMVDSAASTNIASFTFQGAGRLAKTTNQNSTTTDHGYDGFARLSQLDHKNGSAQSFHTFDYLYDKVHNRRMEKNSFNATWIGSLPTGIQPFLNARNGKGDVYAYDMAYRMVDTRYDVTNPATEVGTPGSQTYVTKQVYTLDGLGNRSQTQQTPWGGSATTVAYSFNAMNEYTAIGGTSRTHDSNGNLTDDGTQTYHYDYKNRLVEVRVSGSSTVVAKYKYDALGRRVEKHVVSGAVTTRYILDGQDIVEEFDGNNTWLARYFHEDRIDHPRAMDRADIADVDGDSNTAEILRFTYHQNALGNVSEISAPGGGVVEWVTYDAYGKATVRNSAGTTQGSSYVGNPFLFTGREFDAESGMYHYRARAYDPETGRFLQRDPLGYVDGLGLYEYVGSRPSTSVDPSGALSEATEAAIKKAEAAFKKWAAKNQQMQSLVAKLLAEIAKLRKARQGNDTKRRQLKKKKQTDECVKEIAVLSASIAQQDSQIKKLLEQLKEIKKSDEYKKAKKEAEDAKSDFEDALKDAIDAIDNDNTTSGDTDGEKNKKKNKKDEKEEAKDGLFARERIHDLIWEHLNRGSWPPNAGKGGGTFKNDGRGGTDVIRGAPAGTTYREYDLPSDAQDRGNNRLIIGSDGSAHVTNDHYTRISNIAR